MYKGEVSTENRRPDGKGIKIFDKKSLYEGYFRNGACHGYGRAIASTGEVYEGMFNEDAMDG